MFVERMRTVIKFFIWVRLGLIEIKFFPHLAPFVDRSRKVALGHKVCNHSLGFTPDKRPSKVLMEKRA